MRTVFSPAILSSLLLLGVASVFGADEFSVKAEQTFEFAKKPVVTRNGDQVSVAFETKGFCDVTVAVEDDQGKMVRHLASGVLGPKAPRPFKKNAKMQSIVWDSKDDRGFYVKNPERCILRVSLGLKPRFEKTLFWHPGKRAGGVMAFAPGPEGVFVFTSGHGVDHLRLFDHDGNYIRTVYPFPSKKLDKIPGLIKHRFPDGVEMPIKPNWQQSSFLMSGTNCTSPTYRDGKYSGYRPRKTELPGSAGYSLAQAGGKVALVGYRISRLSAQGDSGGLNLHGPDVSYKDKGTSFKSDTRRGDDNFDKLSAKSIALSPDAKWLYLSMYNETRAGSFGTVIWRHMVMRIRYDAQDAKPEIFAGSAIAGKENGKFNMPADVACDAQGRVYVTDHLNDRVQVFSPDGKHLKNIAVKRPVKVDVHQKTGEIFVFAWALPLAGRAGFTGTNPSLPRKGEGGTYFQLTKFSSLDKAQKLASWDLQKVTYLTRTRASNVELQAAVDTWSDPVKIWITAPSPVKKSNSKHGLGAVVLTVKGDALEVKRDLLNETAQAIVRVHSKLYNRQRLYVNPLDGVLYLAEGNFSHGTGFEYLIRIDPETGKTSQVELPIGTEDMAFDMEGYAYLRTSNMIVRYRSDTWREVPFDYGEERTKAAFGEGKRDAVISGALFPGNKGFHQGGMHVSPKGNIVVAALYDNAPPERKGKDSVQIPQNSTKYQPTIYPGRLWAKKSRLGCILVHILDRHGKMIYADAVPGLHVNINGTAIDNDDNIYLLNASPRVINGKRYFNDHAGTLMKFAPGKGRVLSKSGTPVPMEAKPERDPDLALPTSWVEGADWLYGGVGWGGHNYSSGCSCPNARFTIDYFARSFTPEVDRYNVGVLDSSGNLIVRVGQCGNVDDGMPLDKKGGPKNTRSIGGDETALFFAPYVATHSDKRLFIADPGNARVVSVKLGYHTEARIKLSSVSK